MMKNMIQVAESLRQGRTTTVELCEACLERLDRIKALNAFITVLPQSARQQAIKSQQMIKNS